MTPGSPSWKLAVLAHWAASNLSLLCFSETMRRAAGLGAWVAKSFPRARPYHQLEKSPGQDFPGTLAPREGEWVEGRGGGTQEPQTKLPLCATALPPGPACRSSLGATSSVGLCFLKSSGNNGTRKLFGGCPPHAQPGTSILSGTPIILLLPPLFRGGDSLREDGLPCFTQQEGANWTVTP